MIDVFVRRIADWRVSTVMTTKFVLGTFDQAIGQRKMPDNKSMVDHSDSGSQYPSVSYTERLAEAEIDLSVGTVGDACDNAQAECVIGIFKTEVVNQIDPRKSLREVEWAMLRWIIWCDDVRGFLEQMALTPLSKMPLQAMQDCTHRSRSCFRN